jgi:hypothetical protein
MASPAEEIDVDGIAVRPTNPDKVYFPRLGLNPAPESQTPCHF